VAGGGDFRLRSPAGDDLGDYQAAVPNWLPEDLLYDGGRQMAGHLGH